MNQRLAKKMKRYARKAWKEYWNQMCELSFINRLQLCFDLMRRYKWR